MKNRRTIAVALAALLALAVPASSQDRRPATERPTCPSGQKPYLLWLLNESSETDCDATGGGTTPALCKCVDGTWSAVGSSGSGSTVWNEDGAPVVAAGTAVDVIEPDATALTESPANTARLNLAAYALRAGRSGGQTLYGGTADSDNLELQANSFGSDTYILLNGNTSGGTMHFGISGAEVARFSGETLGIGYISGATTPICFEGPTADANEACWHSADPTADRTYNAPDADATLVQAATCAAGKTVTAIDASTGALTCTTVGLFAGDSITVNSSAATDPDFADGDIDWTLTGGNSITATVGCSDCVTLGTETTGGYAASTTEGGPATTATALAANGANCSAGNYPLGVDASGAVESCTADDDQPDNDGEVPDDITVNSSAKITTDSCIRIGNKSSSTNADSICWDSTYGLYDDLDDDGSLDNNETPIGKFVGASITGSNVTVTSSASVWTLITMDNEKYDVANWHDTSTNNSRVTVDRTGYYRFSWRMLWANMNVSYQATALGLNCAGAIGSCATWPGSSSTCDGDNQSTNSHQGMGCSQTIPLTAGDYVEMFARENSGTNKAFTPNLDVQWVGY